MAKPNYHIARQQRERARKARQQEKLQRRAAHDPEPSATARPSTAPVTPAGPGEPTALRPLPDKK